MLLMCSLKVTSKLTALKGLDSRLREIRSYLEYVIDGKLPLNHEILYHLQVRNESLVFFLVEKMLQVCNYLCFRKSIEVSEMCMQLSSWD